MTTTINADNGVSSGSAGLKESADSSGVLQLQTNGTAALTIDTSQNVGIGTTSPIGTLDIKANATTALQLRTSTSGANQTGVLFRLTDATNTYYCNAQYQANQHIFLQGGTETFRLDSSGNVGIGTSSPASLLDVTGNDPTIRLTDNAGSPTATWSMRSADAKYIIRDVTNSLDRMNIDSSGNVLVTSPAGLGYGTGSGGTVTQATSKSTSVTLNKPTGQITMNGAALAAGATVQFIVNNSLVTASDTVVVNRTTGGSNLSYQIWIEATASGQFYINVKNISAGSLSEAVVMQFAIIKGATT